MKTHDAARQIERCEASEIRTLPQAQIQRVRQSRKLLCDHPLSNVLDCSRNQSDVKDGQSKETRHESKATDEAIMDEGRRSNLKGAFESEDASFKDRTTNEAV
jgi:hypothetical protein